jgi:hypothetical protein
MDAPIPLLRPRLPPADMLDVDDIAKNRDLLTRRSRRQGHSLIETAQMGPYVGTHPERGG